MFKWIVINYKSWKFSCELFSVSVSATVALSNQINVTVDDSIIKFSMADVIKY